MKKACKNVNREIRFFLEMDCLTPCCGCRMGFSIRRMGFISPREAWIFFEGLAKRAEGATRLYGDKGLSRG